MKLNVEREGEKPRRRSRSAIARGREENLGKTGQAQYAHLRKVLERDHFGSYVMINTETAEYVVAATTSEAHSKFIERFGENAPGWCTRIGASVFATA
jgi:hypothetical protein